MSTSNENHIVTPTYQSILMNALNTVINCRNSGNVEATWNALGTLYDWLPSECYDEVTPLYQSVVTQLQDVLNQNQQIDWFIRNTQRHKAQYEKLQTANRILSTAISQSMRKHNWLDRDATIKPRYENKPQMKVEP